MRGDRLNIELREIIAKTESGLLSSQSKLMAETNPRTPRELIPSIMRSVYGPLTVQRLEEFARRYKEDKTFREAFKLAHKVRLHQEQTLQSVRSDSSKSNSDFEMQVHVLLRERVEERLKKRPNLEACYGEIDRVMSGISVGNDQRGQSHQPISSLFTIVEVWSKYA